jgi:hypothetical protein
MMTVAAIDRLIHHTTILEMQAKIFTNKLQFHALSNLN